jgi:hypothetical protein
LDRVTDEEKVRGAPSSWPSLFSGRRSIMSAPVVLVSCVKSKRTERCRAADMYTSPLFRKMMAYAKTLSPKSIFILSAKYGLLSPDDLIEPYNCTLKEMKTAERRAWAEKVLSGLRHQCNLDADKFVFLAGEPYRANLLPHIKHFSVPLERLPFGKQLQWLERHVR